MKKLHRQLLVFAVLMAGFAAAFGSYLLFAPADRGGQGLGVRPAADAVPVRASSHRLTDPERSELTIVEFLDFECEACGAYHPVVEKLRAEYGDRVTFVARYFPMPGHRNGELAARTAEAAARQGKFEEMYRKLFATQKEWGESRDGKRQVFRDYARRLGLDMAAFDADLADPDVAARIRVDQRDGVALGVRGTPTFFVDGEPIAAPDSYEAFEALVDDRLAG
ncbi:DsbA family protein [Streptomyces sp. NPDC093223]|uniref:DsbA family protein n=1 Tax=Streptomyces sp. NPDC093223 TaxID=3366033 RepID=UPI0037F2F88D